MKTSLKITSKGQVTFRREVLDQLGVKPGDRVTVEFVGPGRVEISSAKRSVALADFIGCLQKPGARTLSLDEIQTVAREGWACER